MAFLKKSCNSSAVTENDWQLFPCPIPVVSILISRIFPMGLADAEHENIEKNIATNTSLKFFISKLSSLPKIALFNFCHSSVGVVKDKTFNISIF